jgi:hypothetical protein
MMTSLAAREARSDCGMDDRDGEERRVIVVAMRVWRSAKVVSSSVRMVLGWPRTRTMNHFAVLERDWI